MEVLAIIPARGGSKGVKLKNLKKLGNKPLIEYSIKSAKIPIINRIVVSTDNEKIAKFSKSLGIEIPFLRPRGISGDKATNFQVIKHTLNTLEKNEGYIPDVVVLLQPTSPLRPTNLIEKSIKLLIKTKATSVISVKQVKTHPFFSFSYNKKFLHPIKDNFEQFKRRQSRPTLYFPTGSIYVFWSKTIKKYDSMYGPKTKPIIVNDEYWNMDLDSEFDFILCENLLLNHKKKKSKI